MTEMIGNHIWQSTLFAGAAAFLTLFLRKNHARIRYGLWLAASMKFLVPFALFIALGSSIDFKWQQKDSVSPATISYIETISQPFESMALPPTNPSIARRGQSYWLPAVLYGIWFCGFVMVLLLYLIRWRRVQLAVGNAAPLVNGRVRDSVQRLQRSMGFPATIRLASSASWMEPGIFGILKPVLVLPQDMIDRLGDPELDSILGHEITHVRRRDNLIAALHMFIEALFWFHPMVWWIGAKLVQERERACDEAVLQYIQDPQSYAEGILKVCELCLQSPLACVSGVTGSDMKKRIQAIMTHHLGGKLGMAKKLMLAGAGITALAVPLFIGLLNAPQSRAQSNNDPRPSFEVASIKAAEQCGQSYSPAPGQQMMIMIGPSFQPGRYSGCGSLKTFIQEAYQIKPSELSGGPGWLNTAFFQIEAKTDPKADRDQMRLMLQSLLEERFQLKVHRETKEVNAYLMVQIKSGHKLLQAKDENGNPIVSLPPQEVSPQKAQAEIAALMRKGAPMKQPPGSFQMKANAAEGLSEMSAKAISMDRLADALTNMVGRKVVDKTGLIGLYDVDLKFALGEMSGMIRMISAGPGAGPAPAPAQVPASAGPTIFTALQEQAGLKLDPDKASVEYTIIDSMEKPTEN
jgi:uncharacterized protein (TIGR03435 family)